MEVPAIRTWMAARASTRRLFGVVTMTCRVRLLPVCPDVATRTDLVGASKDTGTTSPLGNVIWLVKRWTRASTVYGAWLVKVMGIDVPDPASVMVPGSTEKLPS